MTIRVAFALCLGLLAAPACAAGAGESESVIARTCVTCHHADNEAIPPLPGTMDREALARRLKELKEGDNTVMRRLVGGIDDESLERLARLLAEGR